MHKCVAFLPNRCCIEKEAGVAFVGRRHQQKGLKQGQKKSKKDGFIAPRGRVFKNRIKIWYKKWCYIGVSKLLIFNTLIYKIVRCEFA